MRQACAAMPARWLLLWGRQTRDRHVPAKIYGVGKNSADEQAHQRQRPHRVMLDRAHRPAIFIYMAWRLLCTRHLSEKRRMQNPQRFWLLLLLSASSVSYARAHAGAHQPPTTIQASAEQHLRKVLPSTGQTVHLKADDLDSRLRLAACPMPLEVFLPNGANAGSRVTTGVRCTHGNQWTIFVPVSIESEVPVLVLNKALARNAAVGAQDVETQVQRVPGLGNSNLKSASQLAGQRLKRGLPAGTVLAPTMLQPELVIRRGQQVTVIASVAGIEVRSQGVALGDASANSRIRVKSLNSAKVIEGLVDNNHMVRVDL